MRIEIEYEFFRYLRQRKQEIMVFIIFCIIFVVSFALYHLPLEAVIYPAGLCFLLSLILMLLDFRRKKRLHKTMEGIRSLTDVIAGAIPAAEGADDEDYQRIIALISDEYAEYCKNTVKKYSDMIDYYTVWAHQIKTPIASMRLHIQNEDTPMSRQLSADLFHIEQYVEMVLTFIRLDSESTDYVIRKYDLDTIIKQSVKKFAGDFIGSKLTLLYEPLNTAVITDEKWLSFVIEQVLSNSIKYTRSGSISITLRPDKKLCISDTGIGIAAEDLPRIFENGFTGNNGRSDKKASGIGLYLCKRICNNLGHAIKVESVVDKGTTVIIDLQREKLEIE